MLNLSDKQRGESALFTLGISAKNISFPFANWSTVPHGRQLVVCLMESFTPRFHISCSVFPGGLNQKKKSITHPHTRTHTEEGWLGDDSNHLWQLLNYLIFLRHFFLLGWETESSAILAPVETDGDRGSTKLAWGVFLQQLRKHLWMWQEMRS